MSLKCKLILILFITGCEASICYDPHAANRVYSEEEARQAWEEFKYLVENVEIRRPVTTEDIEEVK